MKIYVVGLGPGKDIYMTHEASAALAVSDVIIGYQVYIDLISEKYADKELLSTGMKEEVKRCELCVEKALSGSTVSLVCSGDAGVYGMASLMITVAVDHPEIDIEVVAGVTAALSGSAVLGAAELVIDSGQMASLIGIAATEMNMGYAVLYGLFAGVGFTLAIVLMSGLREKIARTDVPKKLKGFPIAMIAAAFIAMAFYVFTLI